MKTCRKWVAALFAIILTVSSCVVVAEEALLTQWDLTEIYENVDAWQADYDRAMEILPRADAVGDAALSVRIFGIYAQSCRLDFQRAAGEDNRPAERGSALCGGFAVGTLFLAAGNAPGVLCRSIA